MSDLPPPTPGRPVHRTGPPRYEPGRAATSGSEPAGLADVLDRILDKGLVIAGDISISLAQVELITIKIRLLLASADKAREMGIDWWTRDPALSGGPTAVGAGGGGEGGDLEEENRALRQRLAELESKMSGLMSERESVASKSAPISAPDLIAMREQRTAPPAPRRPGEGRDRDEGEGGEQDRGAGDPGDGGERAGDGGEGAGDGGGERTGEGGQDGGAGADRQDDEDAGDRRDEGTGDRQGERSSGSREGTGGREDGGDRGGDGDREG